MSALERLIARRVDQVLEALAVLKARARAGEASGTPALTLHLTSGREVTGDLLDYHSREAVAIALGPPTGERTGAVTFVDFLQIAAITVHDAARLVVLAELNRPVPGQQELAQLGGALAQGVAETTGGPLSFEVEWPGLEDEAGRRAVEAALHATALALRTLAETGRTTVTELRRVVFRRGDVAGGRLVSDVAEVSVAPGAEPATAAVLQRGFEAAP